MRWSSLTSKMGQTQRIFSRRDILGDLIWTFSVLLVLLSWHSRASDTEEPSGTGQIGNTLAMDNGESSFATNAVSNFEPTEIHDESVIPEEFEGSVHPSIPMSVAAENERSMTGRASKLLVLLICQILLIYVALRWIRSGEREAQFGTPKKQELQKDQAEYDKKLKKRADLMVQLAAQRAATARVQAEVEAAAKRADEARSATQPTDSVTRGELLKTLASEAAALEAETATLREQLKMIPPVVMPEDVVRQADLAKVYEEQKLLLEKKRKMLEKVAEETVLEAKWGGQLRAEAGDVLSAIASAMKELEELRQRKQQLSSEAEQIIRSAICSDEELLPEDRWEQTDMMNALLEIASFAGEESQKSLEEQKELYEKLLADLEKHKGELESAKAASAKEASMFETQRSIFVDSLLPMEKEIMAYAKEPETLKGIRKESYDMLVKKREEIMCQDLVSAAIWKHEELEAFEDEMAVGFVREDQEARNQEVEALKQELLTVTSPMEKALLETRIEYLEKEMDEAVGVVKEEAKRADVDMFMLLEARAMVKYRAHLGVLNFFKELLKQKPDDRDVQDKLVLAQKTFEEVRLHILSVVDLATTLMRNNSFEAEIELLYIKSRSQEECLALERQRLKELMEETERRREVVVRRYERARKALGPVGRNVSPLRMYENKCNLLKSKTLVEFYDLRLDRIKEEFRALPVAYKDKMVQAGEVWLQAQKDFENAMAQKHAVGIVKEAKEFETVLKFFANIEAFRPEDETDKAHNELFSQIADDGKTDEELLDAQEGEDGGDDTQPGFDSDKINL